MQFQGKPMDQTLKKMIKNLFSARFCPIWPTKFFLQVLPQLVVRHCTKPLSYAIKRKTNKLNLRKWQKKKKKIGHGFDLL